MTAVVGARFQAFRTARCCDRPLPPLEAYEAFFAREHPNANQTRLTARTYRRLAGMVRAGASGDEKARVLGISLDTVRKLFLRLPEDLR